MLFFMKKKLTTLGAAFRAQCSGDKSRQGRNKPAWKDCHYSAVISSRCGKQIMAIPYPGLFAIAVSADPHRWCRRKPREIFALAPLGPVLFPARISLFVPRYSLLNNHRGRFPGCRTIQPTYYCRARFSPPARRDNPLDTIVNRPIPWTAVGMPIHSRSG